MPTLFEEKLHALLSEYRLKCSLIKKNEELEKFRIYYLSSKGVLSQITDEFKLLSTDEKRLIGGLLQEVKRTCSTLFEEKKTILEQACLALPEYNSFDPSLSKIKNEQEGSLHPCTHAIWKLEDIFISMGFEITDGPIVEDEYYNFTALNIPKDHPARDSHDTFWLSYEQKVLRTHTSSVQVRQALKRTAPFSIVSIGRVYRNESTDASHDYMFWQCEGLYVAQDASLANLLYILKRFLQLFFEKDDITIKTRPSFFPFVEPGIEVDMSCPFCTDGCSTCKKTRWIEIGGAGMVHPKVLEAMKVSYPTFSAFAFGFGVTRLIMLKYQIKDIRTLHQSIPFVSKG